MLIGPMLVMWIQYNGLVLAFNNRLCIEWGHDKRQSGWVTFNYPLTLTYLYCVIRGLRSNTGGICPNINTISTWNETVSSVRLYGDSNLIAGYVLIIGVI